MNPILDNLAHLPPVLYKYREFDPDGFGLAFATRGEAYFSSGEFLNDLLECHFDPSSAVKNLAGEALTQHLVETTKRHHPEAEGEDFERLIDIARARALRHKAGDKEIYNDVIKVQHRNVGILSLTENPTSLPMWAHYSGNHTGVCVGIRTEALGKHQKLLLKQSKLMMLHRVNYSSQIPVASVDVAPDGMTEEDLAALEKTFCTKPTDWAYEQEWRLVSMDHVSTTYQFGASSIVEVLVGARASEDAVDQLKRELHSAGSDAVIKKAQRSNDQYGISFSRL